MKKRVINFTIYKKRSSTIKTPIYMLKEPFTDEMQRIRYGEMSDNSREFAYALECLSSVKSKTSSFKADNYINISKSSNPFFTRYIFSKKSPSLGVILTNIDFNRIKKHKNGEPIFWQMGPKRRSFALAQRAHFFDNNHNQEIYDEIENLEKGKTKILPRANHRSRAIEYALGINKKGQTAILTPALTEIGYKKISSDNLLSRRVIVNSGLFNIIGKYPRKIIGLGAMPPVTGWVDTLVTSAVGHMLSFIPRNSYFALNIKIRIDLGLKAKETIERLPIPSIWKTKVFRNIGASLGAEDPSNELKIAEKLFKSAGVKAFRIYTIGSDSRVIETAKFLRQKFGKDIEIFVGQIADKKQAEKLISKDIAVDGLIFGHGGGQQCTSAINGMAITTLEDVYQITQDDNFNKTSILLEGGVGRSIGTALIIGADCVLCNQKLVRGTIETGDLFLENKSSKFCQPYPGSASPVTQIIESKNEEIRKRRIDAAGRTYYTEGKPGMMYYEEKACSMAFWINEYLRHAARTLADIGVSNISQLRLLLAENKYEFLRIMSEKTQYLSDAHGNFNI